MQSNVSFVVLQLLAAYASTIKFAIRELSPRHAYAIAARGRKRPIRYIH